MPEKQIDPLLSVAAACTALADLTKQALHPDSYPLVTAIHQRLTDTLETEFKDTNPAAILVAVLALTGELCLSVYRRLNPPISSARA